MHSVGGKSRPRTCVAGRSWHLGVRVQGGGKMLVLLETASQPMFWRVYFRSDIFCCSDGFFAQLFGSLFVVFFCGFSGFCGFCWF